MRVTLTYENSDKTPDTFTNASSGHLMASSNTALIGYKERELEIEGVKALHVYSDI